MRATGCLNAAGTAITADMLRGFLCKIAGGVTSVAGQDLRAQDPKNQDPRTQKDLGHPGPRTEAPGTQDPKPSGTRTQGLGLSAVSVFP